MLVPEEGAGLMLNDVIHGYWATGAYGGLTEIRVTKVDGGTIELIYFILVSNTDFVSGNMLFEVLGNTKIYDPA